MSRLGFITKELSEADAFGREPELSEKDVDWAVQWERWDLLGLAGMDVNQIREDRGLEPLPEFDQFNTAGVPKTGTQDAASVINDDGTRSTVQEEDPESYDDDYDEWKNDELKDELAGRQLSTSGNKAEMIARLRQHDAAEPTAAPEG